MRDAESAPEPPLGTVWGFAVVATLGACYAAAEVRMLDVLSRPSAADGSVLRHYDVRNSVDWAFLLKGAALHAQPSEGGLGVAPSPEEIDAAQGTCMDRQGPPDDMSPVAEGAAGAPLNDRPRVCPARRAAVTPRTADQRAAAATALHAAARQQGLPAAAVRRLAGDAERHAARSGSLELLAAGLLPRDPLHVPWRTWCGADGQWYNYLHGALESPRGLLRHRGCKHWLLLPVAGPEWWISYMVLGGAVDVLGGGKRDWLTGTQIILSIVVARTERGLCLAATSLAPINDECRLLFQGVTDGGGCGDLLPSGHSTIVALGVLYMTAARHRRLIPVWGRVAAALLGLHELLCSVAARMHYSVDMLVGIVLSAQCWFCVGRAVGYFSRPAAARPFAALRDLALPRPALVVLVLGLVGGAVAGRLLLETGAALGVCCGTVCAIPVVLVIDTCSRRREQPDAAAGVVSAL
eukprot:TRINITY_DN55458_c0_g1_i1.p1 TRINITY_DN55458_c0_g1~~TRINITY_DN55458_c0_g1_i1.p1  ORF type:complete len:466 (+),score=126.95 TRINITY_DN55458_c0_g1_i1:88-1485(+)